MRSPTRGHAQALVALTALFAARVLGQALVAFLDVPLLPPMSAWYSGLLPYPILLPTQLLILADQLRIETVKALRVAACTSSRCGWQAECGVPSADFDKIEKPTMKGQLLCKCSS